MTTDDTTSQNATGTDQPTDAVPPTAPADVDYNAVGYVRSSQYRQLVLNELTDDPMIPSGIADGTGIDIAHVSRALSGLQDRGLVELLVDEDVKRGRYYGITTDGSRAISELDTIDGGDA